MSYVDEAIESARRAQEMRTPIEVGDRVAVHDGMRRPWRGTVREVRQREYAQDGRVYRVDDGDDRPWPDNGWSVATWAVRDELVRLDRSVWDVPGMEP